MRVVYKPTITKQLDRVIDQAEKGMVPIDYIELNSLELMQLATELRDQLIKQGKNRFPYNWRVPMEYKGVNLIEVEE